MKNRILITGGAGFIGSHLVDALVLRGHEVMVLDNLSTGFRKFLNPQAQLVKLDIRDKKAADFIVKWQPDMIYHLAAQIIAPLSIENPLHDAEINIMGTLNILEAARQAKVKRFVLVSSGGLLSSEETVLPTDEEHIIKPAIPYCLSKLAAEDYVMFYREAHALPAAIVRLANVYGPRQNPQGASGVVAIFAERMLKRQPLRLDGDGTQTADHIYVGDVVRALLLLGERPEATGPYHLGTGMETSVKDIFAKLAELTGYDLAPTPAPARLGEAKRRALDSGKIKCELGWEPRMPLDQGLALTVDWIRAQQDPVWSEQLKQTCKNKIEKLKNIQFETAIAPSK